MKTKLLTTAAVLALSLSTGAQASLVARTGGMVYDDVNNITWAADANLAQTSGYDADGKMTWAAAVAWADQLTLGGYTDWSLPSIPVEAFGYNVTSSPMGDLFYNQLGVSAESSIATSTNPNYNLFTNVQSDVYWSGGEYWFDPNYAWVFNTSNGYQYASKKNDQFYAWAVRPGDVAAVPVPGAFWLFGTAMVALGNSQ
jgi:hypothetical protein